MIEKQNLTIVLGKETSDDELHIIHSSFDPYFSVSHKKTIVRLSADILPLVVEFTVAAIGGGILYDAMKGALTRLMNKVKEKKISREVLVIIRTENETFNLTNEKIIKSNSKVEVVFNNIEDFIEHLKLIDKNANK